MISIFILSTICGAPIGAKLSYGAYKNGSNPDIDYAIRKIRVVNEFLCQGTDEKFQFEEELELLEKVFAD